MFLDIIGSRTILMPEAGGASARSFFALLPKQYHRSLVAMDCDPAVKAQWKVFGIPFLLEDSGKIDFNLTVLAPTDEHYRRLRGYSSPLAPGPISVIHHKAACYKQLETHQLKNFALPARMPTVVVRGVTSSGSKDTHFCDERKYLTTEWLDFDSEYVVDAYVGGTTIIYPRVSHQRKHGADVLVTLLGEENSMYSYLRSAVHEAAMILGMRGIASFQFGYVEGTLYFIEAMQRLSGEAWVCALKGGNPLLCKPMAKFGRHNVSLFPETLCLQSIAGAALWAT